MMSNKYILFIPCFLGLLLSITSCSNNKTSYENALASKPNIIFILADDLGYGDLGCYGQPNIKTPNIDKLASQGLRFTQHYAGATVCAPSRNCLITGQHNGHTTIRGMEEPIKEDDITVAELLKTAGYSTAVIGKWGLGTIGTTGYANSQGFDYSFGYYDQIRAHNYYPDYLMENGKKYPLKNEVIYIQDSTHYATGIGNAATKKEVYSNDLFTEKALDFIDAEHSNPFFLYLAYTIPHANNESWLIKEHGMEVPDLGIYNNKDWPDVKKSGAAMISRLDDYVGQVMDKLTEKGLDKETLIIFTSDNGTHQEGGWQTHFFDSNGELKGIKRDLYEGGIRTPFIARWSGKIIPSETNHVFAFWDFMATACDLAGVKLPESSDGVSYLRTLLDDEAHQTNHDYLYWEFFEKQAVRKGNWKAIKLKKGDSADTTVELYDLSNDFSEQTDLSKEYPLKVNELKKIMNQFKK